jgi:hypothetical protein
MLAAALFATLAGGGSAVFADDPVPTVDAKPAPEQSKETKPPPAKPAVKPADSTKNSDDDEGADYDKNAAKRFTPTERTPADRNVSFPVDI